MDVPVKQGTPAKAVYKTFILLCLKSIQKAIGDIRSCKFELGYDLPWHSADNHLPNYVKKHVQIFKENHA